MAEQAKHGRPKFTRGDVEDDGKTMATDAWEWPDGFVVARQDNGNIVILPPENKRLVITNNPMDADEFGDDEQDVDNTMPLILVIED